MAVKTCTALLAVLGLASAAQYTGTYYATCGLACDTCPSGFDRTDGADGAGDCDDLAALITDGDKSTEDAAKKAELLELMRAAKDDDNKEFGADVLDKSDAFTYYGDKATRPQGCAMYAAGSQYVGDIVGSTDGGTSGNFVLVCKCSTPGTCASTSGSTGDPGAIGPNGEEMLYTLSTRSYTSLITQPPGIEVVALGGPTVDKGAVRAGVWAMKIKLLLRGVLLVTATLRPVAGLLPASLQAPDMPAGPANGRSGLTSLNVTTFPGGNVIREAGSVDLHVKGSLPVNVVVSQVANKRIGAGHVETATIKVGETFELMIWTAKASKFASESDQVAHAHLDFKLLKYDRNTVTGPLPEMWGLQPMRQATKTMLSPHAAA